LNQTLCKLVDLGITVHTLQDGQVYTAQLLDETPWAFMGALMIAQRAHEESVTKSKRGVASWANKRRLAREHRKPMTAATPAWVTKGDDGQFKIVKDKQRIVRRIFEEAARGLGHHRITRMLNEQGVPAIALSKTWHDSYVYYILKNEAVIGTYQ